VPRHKVKGGAEGLKTSWWKQAKYCLGSEPAGFGSSVTETNLVKKNRLSVQRLSELDLHVGASERPVVRSFCLYPFGF